LLKLNLFCAMKRGYKKENSLFTPDGRLTEEATIHCRICGVNP
jgi:hypothetical protein